MLRQAHLFGASLPFVFFDRKREMNNGVEYVTATVPQRHTHTSPLAAFPVAAMDLLAFRVRLA